MPVKFHTVGKVYIVTILIKANQRFRIKKVFDNYNDACAYRDATFKKIIHKDDPYQCDILEIDLENSSRTPESSGTREKGGFKDLNPEKNSEIT